MRPLFDSCILIDHFNDIAAATDLLLRHKDAAISAVTWMEVLSGAKGTAEIEMFRRVLRQFRVLAVDTDVAEKAADARRKLRLKGPDALIYGTALAHGYVLFTRNTKDFKPAMASVQVPYRV